jgi:hypothetical protein
MPKLEDIQALPERLRPVLCNRSHWLFVADSEKTHGLLFTIWCSVRATAEVNGWNPDDMILGFLEFNNLPTRHQGKFTVLAFPKAWLNVADVSGVLAFLGCPHRTGGEQDILLVLESRASPETVYLLMKSIESGAMYGEDDGARNLTN